MTSKEIPFIKMHALGNDFVMLDCVRHPKQPNANTIRQLADRNFGIGFDQLLCCEPPHNLDADFFMRIYNADGNEAEQCGNGARCFYHYVRRVGLTAKQEITVQTAKRVISLKGIKGEKSSLKVAAYKSKRAMAAASNILRVRATMGRADFAWSNVLNATISKKQHNPAELQSLELEATLSAGKGSSKKKNSAKFIAYPLSFDNPHLIIIVSSLEEAERQVHQAGEQLAKHQSLLNGANVGFLVCNSKNKMQLVTYERGAGITLACGSNACAAFAVARQLGLVAPRVTLEMKGGKALLGEEDGGIYMESTVHEVFSGTTNLLLQ